MTFCDEVGDRNSKTSKSQLARWEALEERKEIPLCYECGSLFEKNEKQISKHREIRKEFFKLLK
ncbi:MAG: hypothetical protein ACTSRU_08595 [Candidatus Hodarchaeales archaeon]